MGAFDGILKNKTIQNVFLGQFKKIIKDENLKAILIRVDNNGKMEPELFKEDVKVLTIDEYEKLINAVTSQL